MTFFRWLLIGSSSVDHLNRQWLSNRDRLASYQAFTDRQLHSSVVKDTACTQRERFWQRQQEKRLAKRIAFPRKVS